MSGGNRTLSIRTGFHFHAAIEYLMFGFMLSLLRFGNSRESVVLLRLCLFRCKLTLSNAEAIIVPHRII